jgi:hypothetical protein
VREVPKYSQWIQNNYVLERLVGIPQINVSELPTQKKSYEPIFVFEDAKSNALPPKLEVCKIVIDTVYAAKGKGNLAKYKDEPVEEQKKRIAETMDYLYGDETDVSDALAHREGIVVPNKWKES